MATAATTTSAPGLYAITQGTLASPLGYRVQYQGADLTLQAPPLPPVPPPTPIPPTPSYNIQDPLRQALQSDFLSEQRSDVYGRNLSLPYICSAASLTRSTAADTSTADPLASEWGRVRSLPQLSGCLDVKDGGQCAAF